MACLPDAEGRVLSLQQATGQLEVPNVMQQMKELETGTRHAEGEMHAAMQAVHQAAPGMWTAMEELHEAAFGTTVVRAPELQGQGQAAAIECIQVGSPSRYKLARGSFSTRFARTVHPLVCCNINTYLQVSEPLIQIYA